MCGYHKNLALFAPAIAMLVNWNVGTEIENEIF